MTEHAIDLEQELVELVDQAARGEDVLLTKDGAPVARIIPFAQGKKRQFGSARGQIVMSEDFDEPLEDFKDYM